jgi:hypothetical protein
MHKIYKEGIIERQENGIMTIKFISKTADFRYPDAFNRFLELSNQDLHNEIIEEYNAVKEAKALVDKAREAKYQPRPIVKIPASKPPAEKPHVEKTHAEKPQSEKPQAEKPREAEVSQADRPLGAGAPVAHEPEKPSAELPSEAEETLQQVAATALEISVAPESPPASAPKEKNSPVRRSRSSKRNIAFKCAFCDGGRSDALFGYNGICSDETLLHNVRRMKRAVCMTPGNPCLSYSNGDIDREELDLRISEVQAICPESSMLSTWRAGAGFEKVTKPKLIKKVRRNSVCALTTRPIDREKEDERYIYAVFLIGEYSEGDEVNESYVTSNPEYRIVMTPEEAEKLKFWNYYQNENNPDEAKWGSGLFRYLTDEASERMLADVLELKKGTPDEAQAAKMHSFFHEDLAQGN